VTGGELPPGWAWAPLGEVAELKGGLTKGKLRNASDKIIQVPYLRVANVQRGRLDLSDLRSIDATEAEVSALALLPGDVLFNEGGDRDKLGRGWIWEGQVPLCIHQNHVFRARPHSAISSEFLSQYGNADEAQRYFTANGKQSTNLASINLSQLSQLPIRVPPEKEQLRIVAKLDELRARSRKAREVLDEVPALLDKLKQSVLAAAFRGDLTAEWRAAHPDVEPASVLLNRIRAERRRRWEQANPKKKYAEPTRVESDLPELPGSWCWATTDELSFKLVDGVHHTPNYVSSGVPFITVRNLTAGPGISFETTKFLSPTDHEECFKRANPERGDILITKDGTLGVIRVVDTDRVFSIFVSVALIKPVVRGGGDYLALALSAPETRNRTVATGSGLLHLHLGDLRAAPVVLAPADEQIEICRRIRSALSSIDSLHANAAAQANGLASLDQSILAKAFRGELVPQDPNDEPAEKLLARIKAEGAGLGPKKARRG
jgi:type I restriction enzyme S subunit